MKNIARTLGFTGIAAVAFGVSALSASAQVGVAVNGIVGGNSASSATNVSVNAPVNASVNASASGSMDSNANADTNGSVTVMANAAPSSDMSASAGNDAAVSTYANALMDSDANVSNVSSTDSSVTLGYKVPGRFLGIFPIMVNVNATADADGTAHVSYPWYDSLSGTNSAAVTANLSSQVSGVAGNGSASTAADATLSDSVKTSLLNAIHAFFQGWGSSSASASANATASTSAGY